MPGRAASQMTGRFAVKNPASQIATEAPSTPMLTGAPVAASQDGRRHRHASGSGTGRGGRRLRRRAADRLPRDAAALLGDAGLAADAAGAGIWHSGQIVRPQRAQSVQLCRSRCR